jgi:hypothetical protein
MSNHPDWLQKLKEKRKYLVEWLRRHSLAQKAAERAKLELDYTEWQISVFDSRPPSADEIPFPDLGDTIDSDVAYLPTAFPMIPEIHWGAVLSASAFTSSGTQDISAYVGRVGDLKEEAARQYVDLHLDRLFQLEQMHGREDEVRHALSVLANEGTVQRLENAIASFRAFQTSTGTRSAAAADLRTLLDGIKGDLFGLARRHPKENMTWGRMAQRLVKGPVPGPEYDELIRLEDRRSSLISRLSDVVKDRESGSLTDIDQLWIQVQEHIVSTLGLLNLPRSND